MTPFIYMALSFATWPIYMILILHAFYTWMKVKNDPKTLGLTLLASILSLLVLIEVPKAIINILYPESKDSEYQYKWEWTSDIHVLDLDDKFRWFASTCTHIAVNLVVIILTICIVLLWATTTKAMQKLFNIPITEFTIPKGTWKTLWISFLACIALFTIGWISIFLVIFAVIWISKHAFVRLGK